MLKQINKIISVVCLIALSLTATPLFAALSCSVTTQAGCTGTVLLRMSSQSNAHAELPSQSTANYNNTVICCFGSQTIYNTCVSSSTILLKLEKVTNSHVQKNTQSGYTNNTCFSVSTGTTTVAYSGTDCSGYDTTIMSISGITNATVGSSTAYATKVCGSENDGIQRLTFSISTNLVYLGITSASFTQYASSTNQLGSGTEVEAHTLIAKSNATNGYSISVRGTTLTSGVYTIASIGAVSTAPILGTEQFGLRLIASGGSGTTTSPYNGSGFAYAATATSSSRVAMTSIGDNATTTYSVRYVANIAPITVAASYAANIIYVVTANF
jgi:hypothetical protein